MTDEPGNLTLQLLREIREDIREFKTEARGNFNDIRTRLGALETHFAAYQGSLAHHSSEIDRLFQRVEHLEQQFNAMRERDT